MRWMCGAAALGVVLAGCGEFVLVRDGNGAAVETPAPALMTHDLGMASMLRFYGMDGVLMEHVIERGSDNEVQYGDLLADSEGLALVQFSLDQLAGVDPLALDGSDERFAFFLNLYNLGVLSGVLAQLDADPSYTTVSTEQFVFFQTPRVALGGHVWTLDQLEHGIMRGDPTFLQGLPQEQVDQAAAWFDAMWPDGDVDARLHVGVNCSAKSCPNLLREPFRGDTVWAQLDAAATAFVNDPNKGAGPDGISELFTWFEDDFNGSHGSPQGFIDTFRTVGGSVDYDNRIPYDWALNGQ